jgi:hypothetical protein
MTLEQLVAARVENMYHDLDLSCVHTTLRILEEVFDTPIAPETYDASAGMLGGGGCFGGQCGLIQGGIIFISLLCARGGLDEDTLKQHCYDYSALTVKELGSLLCREIRPEGFSDDNPPNLCEPRTVQNITATVRFVADRFNLPIRLPD